MPIASWAIAAAALQGSASPPVEISLPTIDGGVVYADVYGQGERAVVLAHGGRFTKESWRPQVPALTEAGFRVVAIDFRGRGLSRSGPRAAEDSERFDVLAAVSHLRETGATFVAVVGASFGGWAAALAAIDSPELIDRLVMLAHSPVDHPEQLPGGTLFITARNDTTASGVPRLVDIRQQYQRAPEPKELVVLDGSAHAQFVFDTNQGDRLLQEILRFLSEP